jgi:internalin A
VGVVGGGGGPSPTTATGRRLRALRKLLDSQDKTDNWGGLETVRTKEGHLLWLCEYHKAQYRS